jgi:hypothetical protein
MVGAVVFSIRDVLATIGVFPLSCTVQLAVNAGTTEFPTSLPFPTTRCFNILLFFPHRCP